MYYSYSITVSPSHSISNPLRQVLGVSTGILMGMTVFFPPGCANTVFCTLFCGPYQVLPTNPEGYFCGDGTEQRSETRVNLDAVTGDVELICWTEDASYEHTLIVGIDVKGAEEFGLENVMYQLYDVLERLITFMKGWL